MTTSISLRNYNREIESLIEGNQIDEATAHCRHILERYPKHVATYRLLGKAYLEVQKYSDAEDVLQRVLSCIPDDFIAHLGLSIIREEAGDLNAAIWHMERAFDVQPSNAAIQAELRRLYGQRDGTPPVKVTLTRGALARMSARSHLYTQAISELRAILAEDPQRPDLQVVLARLYFQTGQRNAAVETCSSLLNRLPNCLEANRILAEVLPSTERASEAPYYKQRVEAIDPYSAFISPEYPSAEQVPDDAVILDRLVIGLTTELRPPKLEVLETETPPEITPETPGTQVEEIAPDADQAAEIPDWMRTAGWVAATGATREQEPEGSLAVEETPQESEIPEWLRSLSPEEQPVQPEEAGEPQEVELPGWLSGPAAAAGAAAVAAFSGEEEEAQPGEQPVEEPSAPEVVEPSAGAVPAEGTQEEPETLPDWLAGIQSQSEEPAPSESQVAGEELPDWLAGGQVAGAAGVAALGEAASSYREQEAGLSEEIGPGEEGEAAVLETSASLPAEPEAESEWRVEGEGEIPAAEGQPVEEAAEVPSGGAGVPGPEFEAGAGQAQIESEAEEEIPAWLQELSPPEAQTASPEAPVEVAAQAGAEAPAAADAATLALFASLAPEGVPDEQVEEAQEAEPPGVTPDTTPDWLKELAGESLTMETPEAGGEIEAGDTVPDWLRAISEGAVGEAALEEAGLTAAESPVKEATSRAAVESAGEVPEEVPEWLQAAMTAEAVEEARETISEATDVSQHAEPLPIEGDTRPVRISVQPAEELIQPSLEIIPTAEEAPDLAEDQESTFAWLESLGAAEEAGVGEAEVSEDVPLEAPLAEEEFYPEPFEELEEEAGPDWSGLGAAAVASAAAAGAVVGEPADLAEASDEVPPEGEAAPAEPSSLAEILAAAGAVYAAEEILEEEQPPAVLEEEKAGEPSLEEEPASAFLPVDYGWVEEPQPAGDESQFVEEVSPTDQEAAGELPEWLREYETVEPASPVDMEETEWFATAAATGLLDAAQLPPREPEGLLDLNAASQSQLERLPGVGFILAQNIVSFRESRGPFTSLEQLEQVSGVTPEIVDELRQRLTLTIVSESQPLASDVPELAHAWQRLSGGDIPGAVAEYDRMIQQEQQLGEVIKEIQQALALYPADPSLYQALGDAFMRTDRLQEALEAYDRAEDLLR